MLVRYGAHTGCNDDLRQRHKPVIGFCLISLSFKLLLKWLLATDFLNVILSMINIYHQNNQTSIFGQGQKERNSTVSYLQSYYQLISL